MCCWKVLFKSRLHAAETFSDSYIKKTSLNKTTVAVFLFTRLKLSKQIKKTKVTDLQFKRTYLVSFCTKKVLDVIDSYQIFLHYFVNRH